MHYQWKEKVGWPYATFFLWKPGLKVESLLESSFDVGVIEASVFYNTHARSYTYIHINTSNRTNIHRHTYICAKTLIHANGYIRKVVPSSVIRETISSSPCRGRKNSILKLTSCRALAKAIAGSLHEPLFSLFSFLISLNSSYISEWDIFSMSEPSINNFKGKGYKKPNINIVCFLIRHLSINLAPQRYVIWFDYFYFPFCTWIGPNSHHDSSFFSLKKLPLPS